MVYQLVEPGSSSARMRSIMSVAFSVSLPFSSQAFIRSDPRELTYWAAGLPDLYQLSLIHI